MSAVTYAVVTCDNNRELHQAQLETCLREQRVVSLGDETQLDRDLKMSSSPVKLLRHLQRGLTTEWTMFIDDDTWVEPAAVDRVTTALDARNQEPTVVGSIMSFVNRLEGRKGSSGYRQVHGDAAFDRATAWWVEASKKTCLYHGGAGILLNGAMLSNVWVAAFGGATEVHGHAIDVECRNMLDGHHSVFSALTQDMLLSLLLKRAPKHLHHRVCSVRVDPTAVPLNSWEAAGNRVGYNKHDKTVCDLNTSFPKGPDGRTLDAATAVRLATSNACPSTRGLQHVLKGEANLLTWHRFKSPEMFREMQQEVERTRTGGCTL